MPGDELIGGSSEVPDRDPVEESGQPPRHPLEDMEVQRDLGLEFELKMGLERPILTCPCPDCSFHGSIDFRLLGRDVDRRRGVGTR